MTKCESIKINSILTFGSIPSKFGHVWTKKVVLSLDGLNKFENYIFLAQQCFVLLHSLVTFIYFKKLNIYISNNFLNLDKEKQVMTLLLVVRELYG
jgi:hypothetical protein